jgi:hypothetical protein
MRKPILLSGCIVLAGLTSTALAAPGFFLEPKTTFGGGDAVLAPGDRSYLTTGNTERGMAYNPLTNHLYVVSRAAAVGNLSVQILDADTGADVGSLSVSGITGGTFPLSTITVGADGAIYGANLTTNTASATQPLKIYRWANEAATPTVAFEGAPTGAVGVRFGDNIDSRGSGTSTQIVLGGNSGAGTGSTTFNSYAVLTTADGSTFSGQGMAITGPANGSHRLGVAFGPGNTVYGKQTGANNLEYSTFDLAGTATRNTGAPFALTTNNETALDVDAANTLLATLEFSTSVVRLYDISDPTIAPVLLDTETLISPSNTNANGTGAVVFGNGMLWVLNTNNGIQAFNVVVPEPASLGLVGIAGVALLIRRRR